jgi:hypothetical protein
MLPAHAFLQKGSPDYASSCRNSSVGLDAKLEEFEAMMPWAIETTVELVGPEKYTFARKEAGALWWLLCFACLDSRHPATRTPHYNAY